jgi:zinc transporter 1/2/3
VGIGIAIFETVKVQTNLLTLTELHLQSEAETQTVMVTVLQGLATGTLLYVVFFEVIEKERLKGTSGIVQV